jgi:hypothetical protein
VKTPLRTLLKARRMDLRKANPRSRDRIRHKVRVLEVVRLLRRKGHA